MRQTSHTWIIDRFLERFQGHETMNSHPFKLLGDTGENRYKLRIYRRGSDSNLCRLLVYTRSSPSDCCIYLSTVGLVHICYKIREVRRGRFEFHLHQLPANPSLDEKRMVVRMGILDSAERWRSDNWVWPDELINVSYRNLDCLWFKSIPQARVEPDVLAHVRLDGTLHVRCELYRSDLLGPKSGSDAETGNIQRGLKGSPMPSCSKSSPTKRPATDEASTPSASTRRSLLDTGFLADCTLVSSPGETGCAERFRAHKCVLASKSEVFAVMFGSEGFVESKAEPDVVLDSTSAQCLKTVLPWIYNGEFTVADDIQSLEDVLEFAHKYDVADLKMRCELEIAKLLNPTNVVRLHGLAVQLVAEELREATLEFIHGHFQLVLLTSDWDLLKREHPQSAVELLEKSQLISFSQTDGRILDPTYHNRGDKVGVSANRDEICTSRLHKMVGGSNPISSMILEEVMNELEELNGAIAELAEDDQMERVGARAGQQLIPVGALEVDVQEAPDNVDPIPAIQRDDVEAIVDAPEAAAVLVPAVMASSSGSSSPNSDGGTRSTSSSVEQGQNGVSETGSPGAEAQR